MLRVSGQIGGPLRNGPRTPPKGAPVESTKSELMLAIERFAGDLVTLKRADISRVLGINVATVDRWLRTGKVPAPDLFAGRSPRWFPATIAKWLENGGHR
jgi:hypothetical protein